MKLKLNSFQIHFYFMFNNFRKLSSTVTSTGTKILSYGDMIISIFAPVGLVMIGICMYSEKHKVIPEDNEK